MHPSLKNLIKKLFVVILSDPLPKMGTNLSDEGCMEGALVLHQAGFYSRANIALQKTRRGRQDD
jgi:hypothetical protein